MVSTLSHGGPQKHPHCHSHGNTHIRHSYTPTIHRTYPIALHRHPPRVTVSSLPFPPRYLDTRNLYQISHTLSLSHTHTHTCRTLLPRGTTLAHARNFHTHSVPWSMHLHNSTHTHNSSCAHRRPHTPTHCCAHAGDKHKHAHSHARRGRLTLAVSLWGHSPGQRGTQPARDPVAAWLRAQCLGRGRSTVAEPGESSPTLPGAEMAREGPAGRERDLPGGSAPGPGTAEILARPRLWTGPAHWWSCPRPRPDSPGSLIGPAASWPRPRLSPSFHLFLLFDHAPSPALPPDWPYLAWAPPPYRFLP